jgi:putative AlgH/UPF0301 family transcriptional regulator
MKRVKIVRNDREAEKTVEYFLSKGFTKNEVYILAHDKDRSINLTDATETNEILITDLGVFESLAHVFRSRGDELRSSMESLGLSYYEVQQFEGELERGWVVVVAKKSLITKESRSRLVWS